LHSEIEDIEVDESFVWCTEPLQELSPTRTAIQAVTYNDCTFIDETEDVSNIVTQTGVPIVKRKSSSAQRPTAKEHSMFSFKIKKY
jgi:hypothetical protein